MRFPEKRLKNHVKDRMDGKGDAWALEHRKMLGNDFFMQDLDAIFGNICFGQNTGEKLFIEYTPDNWENRRSKIRKFAIIAFFDRKTTKEAAFDKRNTLSTAFYLYLCQLAAEKQEPFIPKFYYVIGKDRPPWSMVKLNIYTGKIKNEIQIDSVDWKKVWKTVGLIDLREHLELWMKWLDSTPIEVPQELNEFDLQMETRN